MARCGYNFPYLKRSALNASSVSPPSMRVKESNVQ